MEQDAGNNAATIAKEEDDGYKQTMVLEKGRVTDELDKHRYDRDLAQIQGFRDYKAEELQRLQTEREQANQQYMAMGELQGLITEAERYAAEVEEMHVEHGFLNIRIKELDDACDYLQQTKEELDEKKKETDVANEDLEKQLKAKEEAN